MGVPEPSRVKTACVWPGTGSESPGEEDVYSGEWWVFRAWVGMGDGHTGQLSRGRQSLIRVRTMSTWQGYPHGKGEWTQGLEA